MLTFQRWGAHPFIGQNFKWPENTTKRYVIWEFGATPVLFVGCCHFIAQMLRCPTWRSIAQHWPRKTLRTNFPSCAWCYCPYKYCPLIYMQFFFHTPHILAWVDISLTRCVHLSLSTYRSMNGVWYVSCLIQIWTCICRILMYTVLKLINVYVQQVAMQLKCTATSTMGGWYWYQCHRCQDAEYLLKLDPPVEYICVSFAQKGQKWSSAVSVFCCSFFWVVNWGQFVDSKWCILALAAPTSVKLGFVDSGSFQVRTALCPAEMESTQQCQVRKYACDEQPSSHLISQFSTAGMAISIHPPAH